MSWKDPVSKEEEIFTLIETLVIGRVSVFYCSWFPPFKHKVRDTHHHIPVVVRVDLPKEFYPLSSSVHTKVILFSVGSFEVTRTMKWFS